MLIQLIELFVLLLLSAFFSASETAFFSLSGPMLKRMRDGRSLAERTAYVVATKPRRLLFAVLFGNMVVNILFFATAYAAGRTLSRTHGAGYAVAAGAVALVLVVVFGEVTPKSIAVNMPVALARFAAFPLLVMQKLLAPAEWFAEKLKRSRPAQTPPEGGARDGLSRDELKEMLGLTGGGSGVDVRLRLLLREVIDFGEIAVHEVMVPRVDMVACRADASLDELIDIIKKRKIKNVPVYGANRDEILGVVSAKDVFAERADDIRGLMKPVKFVPENKSVESLLVDFRKDKQTFAVVVNEYGGTEGIVTIEDVVEEIVGEIEDEFDHARPRIVPLSADSWLVDAGYSLRDFCERFRISAEEERADTVGGFVAALLGDVPRRGAAVRYGSLKLTLREVRRHRPVTIFVERAEEHGE